MTIGVGWLSAMARRRCSLWRSSSSARLRLGDVAPDRLVLDDPPVGVEQRAVGPLLPALLAVGQHLVHLVGHGRRLGREGLRAGP